MHKNFLKTLKPYKVMCFDMIFLCNGAHGKKKKLALGVTLHHFISTFSLYIFCFLCHLGPHLGWCMLGMGLVYDFSLLTSRLPLFSWMYNCIVEGWHVVPSSTRSVMVVVEILEGNLILRFEHLFLGPPPPPKGSMGFSSFFSQSSCFCWVGFACAITMGKKEVLNWKFSTLVF